jgi:hypothetical protein
VAHSNGTEYFSDGIGNHSYGSHLQRVFSFVEKEGNKIAVPTVDLAKLSKRHNIQLWDLIKLDIEGAEYEVLENLDHPIATQLSVEFHVAGPNRAYPDFELLLRHLGKWYTPVVFGETMYKGYSGYWDSLFIMRDRR